MKISTKHINDYLHYGYVPEFGELTKISCFTDLKREQVKPLPSDDEEELIQEGIKVLNRVFDRLLQGHENENHLVPLSGGLDSRVIFCALLERVDPKKIFAISFGSPGSLDYEIPKDVVKNSGVNFERIDCTTLDYSLENLVKAAENGGRWASVPDIYVNRLSLKLDQEFCRWSGFIGDFIVGSYVTKGGRGDNLYKVFAKNQKRVKSRSLTTDNYDSENSLVSIEDKELLNLTTYELIALYNRIPAMTSPILFPKYHNLLTPLIDPEWAQFMLQLPKKYRINSYLFKKIITRMYPERMGIRCKNNAGLPFDNKSKFNASVNLLKLKIRHELVKLRKDYNYPPIGVNYLHYPEAIRKQPSLHSSIREACEAIDKRKIVPWLSATALFQEHLERKRDNSDALLLLLGLEVNLRAQP